MTQLPETQEISLELQDGVLRIWFNRPQARNAISGPMVNELYDVFEAIRNDRSIRVVVVRGKDGYFCAGGDIKGFKSSQGAEEVTDPKIQTARGNRVFGELMDRFNELPQVVIMQVEGAAIGGGFGLTCVGDVTIIDKNTKFSLTETSLGIPPAQIAPFVVQRIGLTQARRLMLTGQRFDGEEAVRLGIGHFLAEDADDLERITSDVLKQMAICAPGANAATKEILFQVERVPRGDALDFAAGRFADCMMSDEGREGVSAFIEKRKPSWAFDRGLTGETAE